MYLLHGEGGIVRYKLSGVEVGQEGGVTPLLYLQKRALGAARAQLRSARVEGAGVEGQGQQHVWLRGDRGVKWSRTLEKIILKIADLFMHECIIIILGPGPVNRPTELFIV